MRTAAVLSALIAAFPDGALAADGGARPPANPPAAAASGAGSPPFPAAGLFGTAAETAGTAASALYHGSLGMLGAAGNAAASASSTVGEMLYEAAYMVGVNTTPLARPTFTDPLPELSPEPAPLPALPSSAGAPVVPPAPAEPRASAPPEPEDEDHGAAPALQPIAPAFLANLLYDRPDRNTDGSYFVPKSLQRMFDVRTERTAMTEVRAVRWLNGRIVPDPKAHGRVEAGLLGRLEPPDGGMPVIGDAVRKGQILGSVVPVVGVVDRSNIRHEIARLTHEIRITAEGLEITKQFVFVPFREGKIIQMEARLEGLRQERAALLPMLKTQEYLRAPIDGLIASSTAVAGRVTQPGETVFDIVNPRQLWVEATVPDPMVAVEATPGASASARTPEGQSMTVTYMGSGPAAHQQSTPMLFRIENPPNGLRVGRPAAILLQNGHGTQRGLLVRRAAVSTGTDGVQQVWEQTDAETFVPHAVQTQDIDAQTVLVLNGVAEGASIVVRGIGLMAQLQ